MVAGDPAAIEGTWLRAHPFVADEAAIHGLGIERKILAKRRLCIEFCPRCNTRLPSIAFTPKFKASRD